MIHDMKPYPAYKGSGVPWLGQVPEHWEVRRLGSIGTFSASGIDKNIVERETLVRMINYLDIYKNPTHELRDNHPYMRVSCPDWKSYVHSVQIGDMFFTPSSETVDEIGFSAVATEEIPNTVYSYHVIRFRPHIELDPLFRKYLCNNSSVLNQFSSVCKGTTRQILTRGDFRNVVVTLPTLPEQSAIVRYLDYMDRRIWHYIHAKQKLIKLLEQQKQAIIHRAVTRGLDPNVKLKPSGVEWLGDVPEGWELIQLTRVLSSIEQGWSPVASEGEVKEDQWAVLTLSSVKKGIFYPRENKPLELSLEVPSNLEVKKGDFLLTRSNTRNLVGDVCVVEETRGKLILCDLIYRLRLDTTKLHPYFLMYQLLSSFGRGQIEGDARGSSSTMVKISHGHIKRWNVVLPPLDEQMAIVNYLKNKSFEIEFAIIQCKKEIDLIREYRTRLIADVVTGKLDVREAAASLPDEVEEPEVLEDEVGEGLDDEQATEFEEEDSA